MPRCLSELRCTTRGHCKGGCWPRQRRLEQVNLHEVPAVLPAGLHAQQGKLARNVIGGDVVATSAGFASLQEIVGEERDVRAQALGAELRFDGRDDGREGRDCDEDGNHAWLRHDRATSCR